MNRYPFPGVLPRAHTNVAEIEAQLRLAIGDEAFDAIPDAPGEGRERRKAETRPIPRRAAFHAPRCAPRRPERQASIERRRRLAASGPMPPALAAHFTQGELAALRIIGDEARDHGCCTLHIDAIAARAGVSRSTVQRALRIARRLGLIDVRERRRRGLPSLTNVVRIVSAEWRLWLSKGGGCQKRNTTDTVQQAQGFGASWRRHWRPYDPAESDRTRLVGAKLSQGSKKGA
jgi:DNA-binding transcriptional ArsR family regulator